MEAPHTLRFLTKFEETRLLNLRASQLEQGAAPVIPLKGCTSAMEQAKRELVGGHLDYLLERSDAQGRSFHVRARDIHLTSTQVKASLEEVDGVEEGAAGGDSFVSLYRKVDSAPGSVALAP